MVNIHGAYWSRYLMFLLGKISVLFFTVGSAYNFPALSFVFTFTIDILNAYCEMCNIYKYKVYKSMNFYTCVYPCIHHLLYDAEFV